MEWGQGSLREDPRTGRWIARYYGPDRRQHSKTFQPNEKTKARKFLSAMTADKARGTWINPQHGQVRFEDWATQWLRGRRKLSERSRARDEGLLRNHVLPTFGDMPIGRIGLLDVLSWVSDMITKGLAPDTIHHAYRLFASPMKAAVAARMIAEAPLDSTVIDLPSIERKRERFLTEHEVELFAGEFPEQHRALVYAGAYTGCRWQELTGLKLPFLDLAKRQLHVRFVVERIGGRLRMKEQPKSEAGRRTVALPAFLVDLLQAHVDALPVGELVFPNGKGGLINPSNFRRVSGPAQERFLGRLQKARAAELEGFTFHDLRHTHAAWCIREGMQPLALQRRLGHRSIKTTMDVYGHLFPNFDAEVIEILDRRRNEAAEQNAKILSLNARRSGGS